MKIKILGSSNANPNPGMGQSGLIIEEGASIYLFDCGDGVPTKIWADSTIDMNLIKAVFITHFDADHFGGIFSMLQLMHQRLKRTRSSDTKNDHILKIMIPDEKSVSLFNNMVDIAHLADEETAYKKEFKPYKGTGVIYKDNLITVSSFPTYHREESHGFVIETQGRKIIYTGDILEPAVVSEYVDNADLVIIEGAHFGIDKITEALSGRGIKRLLVTHLLDPRIKNQFEVMDALKPLTSECPVVFARDFMEVTI